MKMIRELMRKRQGTDALRLPTDLYILVVSNDNVSCLFSRAYIMKRHVLGLNLTFLHSMNETYNIRLFLTQSVKK
jgi:hypothetical protein